MDEQRKNLLNERMNAQCSFDMFKEDRTCIKVEDLPFYKHFRLLEATTFNTIPPVTMEFLLDDDDQVVKLDGTRDPILANNARGGLILNENTIVPYVRFVLGAVQTQDGTIRLTEQFSQEIITGDFTKKQLKILNKAIRPAEVLVGDDGTFMLDAIILYGDSIYRANIQVEQDGTIQILNEYLLADGLPIRPIFLE